MSIGQEDERPIARTVAAHLAGGLQQLLDLRRGEVFAGAPIKIRLSSWGDSRGGGRSRSRAKGLRSASFRGDFPIKEHWCRGRGGFLFQGFRHPEILALAILSH